VGQRAEKSYSFIKDTAVKINSLRPPKSFHKPIFFIILAVLCILAAGKLLSSCSRRQAADISVNKNTALSAPIPLKQKTRAGLAKKTAVSEKEHTTLKMKKEITSGFLLGILAKDKCWISLKVDGRLVFHGMLAKGRFESWKAKDKIELSLGDAAAVELQVNDQRFPKLGRRGQSLRALINKDGLKIGK
jgi:hypothetical protein